MTRSLLVIAALTLASCRTGPNEEYRIEGWQIELGSALCAERDAELAYIANHGWHGNMVRCTNGVYLKLETPTVADES